MPAANSRKPKPDKKLTAYLGHVISPIDGEKLDNFPAGALVVDEAGTICDVGLWQDVRKRCQPDTIINLGKKIICPGFVDLHIHLPQISITGKWGKTLLGWLETYTYPTESAFADTELAREKAYWFFDELAKNGTTLACVYVTVHNDATNAAFEVAAQRGARVIMGKVMMDRETPLPLLEITKKTLDESDKLCKKWHGHDQGRLLYAFTPRFAVTSSQELLSGTGHLWLKHPGSYLQSHLSENKSEVESVHKHFVEARSYLDVYRQHGMLGSNSLFAHGIYLNAEDLALLRTTATALAHCPCSNFFIKSGVFPFRAARDAGVKFGLGSDLGAGPEMSLFKAMKDAAYMQANAWISPTELFYLSTLAGAKAVNLDSCVGSLTPGKEADFVIIDPSRKTSMAPDLLDQSVDDILSQLVYLGDDRIITATFIRGRAVYQAEELVELSLVGS